MPSRNLDLVRSIYADWERGDFHSAGWADPEIGYVFHAGPEPGGWTGVAEMRRVWFHALESRERYSDIADEYRELADGRVLVLTHPAGRGKTSRVDLEQIGGGRGALLVSLRDAKVTRLDVYWDPDRALADLGLEE
jgi:ketosteroid isomerase-like protein